MIFKHKKEYVGAIQIIPSKNFCIKWKVLKQLVKGSGSSDPITFVQASKDRYAVRSAAYPAFQNNTLWVRGRYRNGDKNIVVMHCYSERSLKLSKVINSFVCAGFDVHL